MYRHSLARFGVPSLAVFALVAAIAVLAGAPEAFAAIGHAAAHSGSAHDFLSHAIGASFSVAALRAKIGDLETRATGKMAELKDGLASDEIRTIETDHGTILTEIEAARRDLVAAEAAERTALQTAGTLTAGTPDIETVRAQERMHERSRQVAIRGAAIKLGLGEDFFGPHIERGTSLADFRGLAIDAAAARQAPVANPNPGASDPSHRTYAQAKEELPKGTDASRAMLAMAACRGNKAEAAAFVEKQYGRSGEAVARALSTSVGTAGGFLVPDVMSTEIIELLRPESVVMALGPNIIPMPNGNFSMGRQTGGALASYVGETAVIPASQQKFGKMQLSAKKLAALVPLSNDMIRFPSVAIDTVVRNDMVAAIAQRADLAFLRGTGGQYSPRGFLSLAADPALAGGNVVVATPTVTLQTVTTDLGNVELALANANVKMRKPGWVMSQRSRNFLYNLRDGLGNQVFAKEMSDGMLRGKPFRATTQIPNNLAAVDGSANPTTDGSEIYLADFAEVYVGEAHGLEIAVFDGGTYVDENGVTVSGISTDETVMRAIVQHDINMRQQAAVAVLIKVRWY